MQFSYKVFLFITLGAILSVGATVASAQDQNPARPAATPPIVDCARALEPQELVPRHWTINTSNPNKVEEFKDIFGFFGQSVSFFRQDLEEIHADPLKVVAHKASRFKDPAQRVLVEDSSLDVDGADFGVNIKWLYKTLTEHLGKSALWRVCLAFRDGDQVFIYKAEVPGRIVEARGGGHGFDPMFLPDGHTLTLGQAKPLAANARALAIRKLLFNESPIVEPALEHWEGKWQNRNNPDEPLDRAP